LTEREKKDRYEDRHGERNNRILPMIKPISGLFLIFWGVVKVFQGFVLLDGGEEFGAALIILGALAALAGGLLLQDALR